MNLICTHPDICVFYAESINEGKAHWRCNRRDDIKNDTYVEECQNHITLKDLKWKI